MSELPKRMDNSIEKKWQQFWIENKIFYFNEKDKTKKVFVIDSPPPFTSGYLHMGHVLSYSYFDFVAKYKKMKGFNVYYPQGWDCQGFPTEVKVEKKYGKKSPDEFRALCVSWTEDCISKMKNQMISLGFCPDWRYEYKTMSKDYHKMVQLSIIKMFNMNQIYRAIHPVFWCTKCLSALSKTDTEDINRTTNLYTILFELETDNKKSNLEVATTRPELLHACVAVLYNPADKRFSIYKGKEVYAYTPLGKKVPFLADEDVDLNFGTGVVMVCTFGDKQDVIWSYRHKLGYIEAMDKTGRLINSGIFDGLNIKEAKQKIVEYLEKNNKIIAKNQIEQSIKVHDRCGTEVELLNSYQWFAKITTNRENIISLAKSIRWYPDFAIAHLIDWASYVEWDWVISRQRIFGTPIPFWVCKNCQNIIVPNIDELPVYPAFTTRKCPKCGQIAEGETSVFDCWVDSSITPLIISKWEQDKDFFALTYPADLRPQGVEIIRTWAFYTIYRCSQLTGKIPFKEILLNGNVLAPDGKKMSKSLGNIIEPDDLIKNYGADAVRIWAALSGAMAKDRPFSYQDLNFGKNFVNKVLNASKFVLMAKNKCNIDLNTNSNNYSKINFLYIDKIYLAKLYSTIKKVDEHWQKYEFHHIIKELSNFFWHNFCDYYLEFIKYRVYSELEEQKSSALFAANLILSNSLLLLAPFVPHLAEEIWAALKGQNSKSSIFFEKYPSAEDLENFDFINKENLLNDLELFESTVLEIRKLKAGLSIASNQKLEKLIIKSSKQILDSLKNFESDLKHTLNIQNILFEEDNNLKGVSISLS
jgi:valyl-tRNA synthetase